MRKYHSYSKDQKENVRIMLIDPNCAQLNLAEIGEKCNMSPKAVSEIHKTMVASGKLPAYLQRNKGRRRSTGTSSKPIVHRGHTVSNEQVCEIRNMALLGESATAIAIDLGIPVNDVIPHHGFARRELNEGTMTTAKEYFTSGGVINRRVVDIPARAVARAERVAMATSQPAQSTNPFVDLVRDKYKAQMKEAMAIVMAEAQAELLGK